jgi:phospholipase/lecithinase/hemolysin
MIKQFKISGEQFVFSDDNHWNANGHRLMAKELYRVPAIQNLCQNSSR